MASCQSCTREAVHKDRCLDHHCEFVENTVTQTIQDHDLFTKQDKLCVAVSGGKDSQVLLHILHAHGYNVSGLLIDEGIKGYRQPNMDSMVEFCAKRNIPLRTVVFQEHIGTTLDNVAEQTRAPPCSACGAWRRQMLNKFATGFDYVVTGHNLDDESQTRLMNILLGKVEQSLRIGLKTRGNGFVRRVKPLFFLSEKDIRLYTLVKNFDIHEDDCPYASKSFRWSVRDMLNEIEAAHPGSKLSLVNHFLDFTLEAPQAGKKSCSQCGQPSMRDVCMACSLKNKFAHNPAFGSIAPK